MTTRPQLCKSCSLPADAPIHTGGHPGRTHVFVRTPRELPILFSVPMIRALLAGSKTQTRRLLKMPPGVIKRGVDPRMDEWMGNRYTKGSGQYPGGNPEYTGDQPPGLLVTCLDGTCQRVPCPYGIPGDKLWAKETWARRLDEDHLSPSQLTPGWAWYWADPQTCNTGCAGAAGKKRVSIHMPRWASRITLEVTDVRVQRLQDISEEDARTEGPLFAIDQEQTVMFPHLTAERNRGCSACRGEPLGVSELCHDSLRGKLRPFACWYATVWDGINGAGSWERNPWVWCVSFSRVEAGR